MQQAREITERYHLGGVIGTHPGMRSLGAIDRASGEAVVFELVPNLPAAAAADQPARFLAAATELTKLRHSAVPVVLDYGVTAAGDLFLVREADSGRDGESLGGGESPVQVLRLLLEALGGLALLDAHGLHHGAITADALRVVPAAGGPGCRVVGLAHGMARGVAEGAEAERRRRDDFRSLAALACRLLGATVRAPASPAPEVKLPLAVSFEIEDAEALRRLLERCLRREAGERPASYDEIQDGLSLALWGRNRPSPVEAPAAPPAPPVRLTFSTEPPDVGLVAPAGALAATGGGASEVTKVVEADELAGVGEAAGGADDSARGPDDTAPGGDDTSPGAGGVAGDAWAAVLDGALPGPEAVAASLDDTRPEAIPAPRPLDASEARVAPGSGDTPPAPAPAEALPALDFWSAVPPELDPGSAAPPAPDAAAPGGRRRRRWGIAAAAGTAALVGLAVVGILLMRGSERPPSASPAVPPRTPAPVPRSQALPPVALAGDPRLLRAKALVTAGDDAGAAAALAALTPEEEAALSAADCELAGWLRSSLEASAQERFAAELAAGLAAGDLPRLSRVLAELGSGESAFLARYPESTADLQRARRAAALDRRARQALARRDYLQAIESAGLLQAAFPAYSGADPLREEAAAAIEAEAEALASEGRLEPAVERLLPLAQAWPERPGLTERIEDFRARLRSRRDFEALIAAAQEVGERGRPEEGLTLLAGAAPGERLQSVLEAARRRLTERLADLDRQPPTIELAAGSAPEVVKGQPVEIVLRVRDDYRVARVAVFVRPEGGRFAELPHRQAGAEVVAEVTPEVHLDKSVEFYATAADPSGHESSLGSAERPLELRRRRWYHRFTD